MPRRCLQGGRRDQKTFAGRDGRDCRVGADKSCAGAGGQADTCGSELADRLGAGIPVEMHDERFTTLMARRSANGGSAGEDSRAAAHLLEGWLAARER